MSKWRNAPWMAAAGLRVCIDDDCRQPCDDDCELGPEHCEWAHLPSHKPGWHSADDCPHTALLSNRQKED